MIDLAMLVAERAVRAIPSLLRKKGECAGRGVGQMRR
jgi:hypothetical protein